MHACVPAAAARIAANPERPSAAGRSAAPEGVVVLPVGEQGVADGDAEGRRVCALKGPPCRRQRGPGGQSLLVGAAPYKKAPTPITNVCCMHCTPQQAPNRHHTCARIFVWVKRLDCVGQATHGMHYWGGGVGHGVELVEAAGLEARGHQKHVHACTEKCVCERGQGTPDSPLTQLATQPAPCTPCGIQMTCPSAYPPASVPACLRACLPACLPIPAGQPHPGPTQARTCRDPVCQLDREADVAAALAGVELLHLPAATAGRANGKRRCK